MSRCYPFPPPGYVKSAPVELDLSSKKEKRRHKDKKKKRKKHSATNGDLTIKEDDRQFKATEQSGQPKEGFSKGNGSFPSATISQGPTKRLQTKAFVDDAISNRNLASDFKREQGFKPREELLSSKLAADNSRHHVLLKGVNGTNSSQRLQGGKSIIEGSTDSGFATIDEKSRLDSARVLSTGVPVASSCKRPEQAENTVFSNGVLSTKRKRLQADNSGDGLLPKSVLAAACKKSDDLQPGRSRRDLLMQAPNTVLQGGNSGNLLISKNGLPTDFERSEKRVRSDPTILKVGTSGACSVIGQAETEKVSYHLLANAVDRQEDTFKPDVRLNGLMSTNCGKMQMGVRQPKNGKLMTTKCDEFDKRLQPGKISPMNPMQDSTMSNSSANRFNARVHSESSVASKCTQFEQRLQGITNVLTNGVAKAENKRSESAGAKGGVSTQGARATCGEKSHIDSSRHDIRVLDVKTKADKTCNLHSVLDTGCEHTGSRWQADGFKNRVLLNGVLAGHQKELNQPSEELDQPSKVGINLSSPALGAAIGNNSAAPIKAPPSPKVLLDFEDKLVKEKLMKIRLFHPGHTWVTTEDEDWLVSCKQQLQSKQAEKGEEAQIQQVWAETVLLPAVGLNALPYVIPN